MQSIFKEKDFTVIKILNEKQMLLINIFINGFRSYASPTNIQLSATNTILKGQNGSGKSSIIQAIRYGLGYKYTSLSNMEINNMLSESPGKDWRSASVVIRLTLSIASITKEQRTCLKNGKFPIAEDNNEVVLQRKIDSENDELTCNESKLSVAQLFYLLNILKITQIYEFSNIVSQNTVHTIVDMGAPNRTRLLKNYVGVSTFEKQIKGLSNFLNDLDKKDIPRLEESKTFIIEQINKLESERDGLKELKDLEFKKDLLEYRVAEQKKKFLTKKLDAVDKLLQDSQKRIEGVNTKKANNEQEITERKKEKNKKKNTKQPIMDYNIEPATIVNIETTKDMNKAAKSQMKRNEQVWKKKVTDVFNNHGAIINNNLIRFKKKMESQNVSLDLQDLKTRDTSLKSSVKANDEKIKIYKKKQKKLEKTIATIEKKEGQQNDREKAKAKKKTEINELKVQRRKIWEQQNNKTEELNELIAERKEFRKKFRYAISLKNVLALKFARGLDEHAGVYGALLDLMTTNSTYNKAIIASIGKRLFTVLVENDESLKFCLNELRKFNGENTANGLPFISVTFMKVTSKNNIKTANEKKQGVDFKKYKPLASLVEVSNKKLKLFIRNTITGNILYTDKIESSALEIKGYKIVDRNGILVSKGSVEGGYIEDYLGINTSLNRVENDIFSTEDFIEKQAVILTEINKTIEIKQGDMDKLKEDNEENNIHELVKYKKKQRVVEMNINKCVLSNEYLNTQLKMNVDLVAKVENGKNDENVLLDVLNSYIEENTEKSNIEGYPVLSNLAAKIEDKEELAFKTVSARVGMHDVTNTRAAGQVFNVLDNTKDLRLIKSKIRKLYLNKTKLERQSEVLMADISSKLRDKNHIIENLELIQAKMDRVDDRYKDGKEGIKISLNENNKIKSDSEINREIALIDTQIEKVRKCTNKKADLYYERFVSKKIQIDRNMEEILGLQRDLSQHLETFENIKTKFFADLSNGIIKEFKQLMFYFDRSLAAKLETKDGKLEFNEEVKDFSGGQKALVGLCYIMAIKFAFGLDLVVLDEVDANLDIEYVKKLAALIKRVEGKGKLKGQILMSSFKEDILNLDGDKKLIEITYEDGHSNIKETNY